MKTNKHNIFYNAKNELKSLKDKESEILLYLSFGNMVEKPINKHGALVFGGLPFISCETVKIGIASNFENSNTAAERLEKLKSVYDFECFEKFLTAILAAGFSYSETK